MELVNQTLAQAELFVSAVSPEWRIGNVIAKLTFRVGGGGQIALEDEAPVPVFDAPVETELGAFPSDLTMTAAGGPAVFLIGAAYPPSGPAREQMVAMRVGATTRHLRVVGDRVWMGSGEGASPSEPLPYARMPLGWDRAFGGEAEVWLDPSTRIPLRHPANARGKGADLARHAAELGRALGAPAGFPRLEYERALPNLEHPLHPIRSWADDPEPYSWALPPDELIAWRASRRESSASQPGKDTAGDVANPDWNLRALNAGDPVVVEGCTPGNPWWFTWSAPRVSCDYVLGGRRGTLHVPLHHLVLLTEESRFTATFVARFKFEGTGDDHTERSLRLRLE